MMRRAMRWAAATLGRPVVVVTDEVAVPAAPPQPKVEPPAPRRMFWPSRAPHSRGAPFARDVIGSRYLQQPAGWSKVSRPRVEASAK